MGPTSQNSQDSRTVAEPAQAKAQAKSQPPQSTVPLYFRPAAALAILLPVFLVISPAWQVQGQFQDNSLASLASHIWQPALDLQQPQQQRQVNTDSQPNSIEQSINQNAIGPGLQQQQQQAYPILEQQFEAPTSVKRNELVKLERRIDRLEFELRKSLHQMQNQHKWAPQQSAASSASMGTDDTLNSISRTPDEIASGQRPASTGDDLAPNQQWRQNNQQQPTTTASSTMSMIDLGERLSLVEKFITITTTKMYELDRKVKQLDKCECQISCKWSVPSDTKAAPKSDVEHNNMEHQEQARPGSSGEPTIGQARQARFYHDDDNFINSDTSNGAASRLHSNGSSSAYSSASSSGRVTLFKRDGQVWHDKCNICSCHKGHVSCKRASCPRPDCDDPQQVPGRCCPVCYKPCTFRQQTVRHGNKLVINSNEQTCKECSCFDGRFQCQRINMVAPASSTTARNGAGATSSRLQRQARPEEANLHDDDNNSDGDQDQDQDEDQDEYNWQQDSDTDNNGAARQSNYDSSDRDRAESDKLIARDNYGDENNDDDDDGNDIGQGQYEEDGDNEEAGELLHVGLGESGRGRDYEAPNLQPSRRSRPARNAPRVSVGAGEAAGPLFCPPANCAESEQIRLENDCCTYCANFDFCALPWRHLPAAGPGRGQSSVEPASSRYNKAHREYSRCHPQAVCTNTLQRSSSSLSMRLATNESGAWAAGSAPGNGSRAEPLKLRSISSMFSCECRPGFRGDGLTSCADIDECADERLHDCDLKTTRCVNLAGSYECQCKRGFKPATEAGGEQSAPIEGSNGATSSGSAQQPWLMSVSVPAGERRLLQRCKDVDECQDGKLNRCHPQARCINTAGAYKCQCKRGYLGNGFECHKWFTSGPDVAAYLYRHESDADSADDYGDDEGDEDEDASGNQAFPDDKATAGRRQSSAVGGDSTQTQAQSQQAAARKSSGGDARLTRVSKRVNLPLNTLDEDDDQDDDRTDMIAYLDESSGAPDQFEADDRPGQRVPKLSESKWEPLKYSAEAFSQQQAYTSGQASQAANLRKAKTNATSDALESGGQQRQASADSSSLNTRTMFMQPPPRLPRPKPWWDEPEQSSTTTSTMTTPAKSSGSAAVNVANRITSIEPASAVGQNQGSSASTLSPGSSAEGGANRSSVSPQKQEQSPKSIQTLAQQSASSPVTASNGLSANKKLQIGYKRGTIIASASSSPRKGTLAAASSSGGGGSGMVANERPYSSSQQQPFRSQQMVSPSSGSASSNIIAPSHRFSIIMTTTLTATWLGSQFNIWTQILANSTLYLVRGTYLSLAMIALSFTVLCIQCNHIVTIYPL